MVEKSYIQMEHMADIKYKISGKSLSEIFENTASAFSSYLTSGKRIKSNKKKTIELSADNIETLLYKFIDELIFLLDAQAFAVSSAKVIVDQKTNKLSATLSGFNSNNHHLNHVKAATYAEMYIKNNQKSWEAQIVLDV